MQDLPEQQPDGEPIVEIVEEVSSAHEEEKVQHDGLTFLIREQTPLATFSALEKPQPPSKPVSYQTKLQDLLSLAHYIHHDYQMGFSWAELPHIIEKAIDFIEPSPDLTPSQKHGALMDTLLFVVAQTDLPYLPEGLNNSTFATMLPPFTYLALEASSETFTFTCAKAEKITSFRKEKPTQERLEAYVKNISRLIPEKVTWQDLSRLTRLSLAFMLTFEKLSPAEISAGIETILFYFLDQTESSNLPPDYVEVHFKPFFSSLNKYLIEKIAVQNNH